MEIAHNDNGLPEDADLKAAGGIIACSLGDSWYFRYVIIAKDGKEG
jgi:hypothetical protein